MPEIGSALILFPPMFPWTDSPEPLRFDRFMEAALHDPEQGYYARRIRGVGAKGDFTTTAAIAPALGKAIARWAEKAMQNSQCRDLIELGPGEGTLAKSILRHLPWFRRHRIRLHLVESSAPLIEKQKQLLGSRVQWHATAADALAACNGRACLYSNEFVDAFPVRRFQYFEAGWHEQFLLPERDEWRKVEDLPASTQLTQHWPLGQVVEVHQSYFKWLRSVLPLWRQGRMLTIDYGARDADLYHRQPHGSLRAYFHHQRLIGAEALARPGHQDLTADVNFDDLIDWTRPEAELISINSQAEFLSPFVDPNSPADRYAVDPAGPGNAFLYLDQRRV